MNIQTPIAVPGVVPIDDVAPAGWKPDVVLMFVIDFEVNAGHLHFKYGPKAKMAFTTMDDALERARNIGHSLTLETPLDINVEHKALVFVGLAEGRNWEFSPRSDGASRKKSVGSYGNLLHVFDKITIAGGEAMKSGCRMLCFSAFDPPKTTYAHGMNFHVDIIQPEPQPDGTIVEKRVPLIIDPDIRHPGGNVA